MSWGRAGRPVDFLFRLNMERRLPSRKLASCVIRFEWMKKRLKSREIDQEQSPKRDTRTGVRDDQFIAFGEFGFDLFGGGGGGGGEALG